LQASYQRRDVMPNINPTNLPAEVEYLLNAVAKKRKPAVKKAIAALKRDQAADLLAGLPWNSEAGVRLLERFNKKGGAFKAAANKIMKRKLPPTTLFKNCCDESDCWPFMAEMICACCCCCRCWPPRPWWKCRCGILVYPKDGNDSQFVVARSLYFEGAKVTKDPDHVCRAHIEIESSGPAADVEWADILNKPVEFPPEDHDHDWADIVNEPAVYPPEDHDHDWADIVNEPTEYPPEDHGHDWADIVNEPTEYPPEDHDHDNYADIVHTHDYAPSTHDHDLEYSDISHGHDWADITNEPTEYPPEYHGHDWADIVNEPTEYPPEDHDHDNYADIVHTHDYATSTHNHDTDYADIVHTHDYATSTHNHDTDYADIAHTHDYSPSTHDHDTDYADIVHTHDYAPSTHNHDLEYYTETEIDTQMAGKANKFKCNTNSDSGTTGSLGPAQGTLRVDFPIAFTNIPVVQPTVVLRANSGGLTKGAVAYAEITSVDLNGFDIKVYENIGGAVMSNTAVDVTYLAIEST
jgi:hypothetical protein